jgi:hypothetical protein
MKWMPSVSSLVVTATAALLAACGEGTGPNASGQVGVGFRLVAAPLASANVQSASASSSGTGTPAGQVTSGATATGFSIKSGADEILITKAQVVVKNVKLKSVAAVCANVDDDDMDGDDEDDCPTIRVGPFLVNVPVNGTDGGRMAVPVPAGTYSAIRFEIHKVTSSDSTDRAFRQANPDFREISVRLEGTYNAKPFVFTHDVNATLDVPLTKPVEIGAAGDNVTVTIDMSSWFTKPAGGLYNPAEGNVSGLVRAKIQNNIRAAFKAFRDTDRDGEDDD